MIEETFVSSFEVEDLLLQFITLSFYPQSTSYDASRF